MSVAVVITSIVLWVVGAALGSSCDSDTSGLGGVLILVGGLLTAGSTARVWLDAREGSLARCLYIVPLSLVVAAVPTGIAALVAVSINFDRCFTLGF